MPNRKRPIGIDARAVPERDSAKEIVPAMTEMAISIASLTRVVGMTYRLDGENLIGTAGCASWADVYRTIDLIERLAEDIVMKGCEID